MGTGNRAKLALTWRLVAPAVVWNAPRKEDFSGANFRYQGSCATPVTVANEWRWRRGDRSDSTQVFRGYKNVWEGSRGRKAGRGGMVHAPLAIAVTLEAKAHVN
jgi:hypothetical protein